MLDASIRMNVTEIVDRSTPARKPADPTSAYLPNECTGGYRAKRVLPMCSRVCDGRCVRADSDGHRSGHAQPVMHSLAPEAAPRGADRDRRDKEACDGSGAGGQPHGWAATIYRLPLIVGLRL